MERGIKWYFRAFNENKDLIEFLNKESIMDFKIVLASETYISIIYKIVNL